MGRYKIKLFVNKSSDSQATGSKIDFFRTISNVGAHHKTSKTGTLELTRSVQRLGGRQGAAGGPQRPRRPRLPLPGNYVQHFDIHLFANFTSANPINGERNASNQLVNSHRETKALELEVKRESIDAAKTFPV